MSDLAQTREETVQLPILRREATVEAVDQKNRIIRFRFSTGARRKTIDWNTWRYIDEELSCEQGAVRLNRLQNGAPFLKDHRASMDCQIGVHTGAWLESGAGWGTARIFDDEDSDKCFQKIVQGARNISVGYQVHTYEVTEREGQRPLYRAVDWEPVENSLVAIPADADAQIRTDGTPDPNTSTQPQTTYPVRIRSVMNEEQLLQLRGFQSILTRLGAANAAEAERSLTSLLAIATAARAATGKDTPAEVEGGLKALSEARSRAAELDTENKGLKEKLTALEGQELKRTYESLTEAGQRDGKLPPAMVTWARSICLREEKLSDGSVRTTYLPEGLNTLRGFLDVAVPVGPGVEPRTVPTGNTEPAHAPIVLSPEDREVCRKMGISEEKFRAAKQAEREAAERAKQ